MSDLVCVHNFRYKTHDFSETTNTLYCCIKRNPYHFISQQQYCNIKQTLISPLTMRCLCTAVGKLRLVPLRVLINTDWLSLWGLDNWITSYIPWQYKHSLPNQVISMVKTDALSFLTFLYLWLGATHKWYQQRTYTAQLAGYNHAHID